MLAQRFSRPSIQRIPRCPVHAAQRAQRPLTWLSPPVEAVARDEAVEEDEEEEEEEEEVEEEEEEEEEEEKGEEANGSSV
ncbi:hypothetical protein SprV_1002905700 [Sparganum proliferum]